MTKRGQRSRPGRPIAVFDRDASLALERAGRRATERIEHRDEAIQTVRAVHQMRSAERLWGELERRLARRGEERLDFPILREFTKVLNEKTSSARTARQRVELALRMIRVANEVLVRHAFDIGLRETPPALPGQSDDAVLHEEAVRLGVPVSALARREGGAASPDMIDARRKQIRRSLAPTALERESAAFHERAAARTTPISTEPLDVERFLSGLQEFGIASEGEIDEWRERLSRIGKAPSHAEPVRSVRSVDEEMKLFEALPPDLREQHRRLMRLSKPVELGGYDERERTAREWPELLAMDLPGIRDTHDLEEAPTKKKRRKRIR